MKEGVKPPTLFALCLLAHSSLCASDEFTMEQLYALSLQELMQVKVTTPSGSPVSINKAAGVATLITANDIKAMGANDLEAVLEAVPGIHVGRNEQTNFIKPTIRAITSSLNAQTLVLVNGIPLTTNVSGNRANVIGTLPLKAVERIEVIRGPGSALYGADAYAGVVNVITKTPDDLLRYNDSVVLAGMSVGTFDTRGGWLQMAARADTVKAGVFLEYQTTDGYRETVTQDAQTAIDSSLNTSASLAPGSTNNMVDQGLFRLELDGEHWRLRSGYQQRTNIGSGFGIASALDPHARFGGHRYNADFSYFLNELMDNTLDIESRISFLRTEQHVEETTWLYPPGAFGGLFPDGFSGNPGYREDQARYDLSGLYQGFHNHQLRVGVGFYWGDLYEVTETRNFQQLSDGSLQPTTQLLDITDTDATYLPEVQRTSHYLLVQDEWKLAETLQLTLGVRGDDYSDFGSTVNPRLALVWDTTSKLNSKLLYGRAFRAPAFAEMFVRSPVHIGSPELKPETIDTWEIALSLQASPRLRYGFNLFHYKIEDFITTVPIPDNLRKFENVGERTGNGGEIEFTWLPSDTLKLVGNYSYAHAVEDNSDELVGEFPAHQLYFRLEWKYLYNCKLSPQLNYVGEQPRSAGDQRKPVAGYTTVDITLRQRLLHDRLELSLIARNAFDEDVREPSAYGEPVAMPDDFPMAGRSFMGEISYNF